VSESPTYQHPRLFRLYYLAVMIAAATLLFFAARDAGPPQILAMLVVLGFLVFNELSPVSLPGGGYATPSTILDLPAMVILGPFWAAIVDVIGTLAVQGAVHRKPPVRVAHNAAIFAITYVVAGAAFALAGGRFGAVESSRHIGALLVAGAVYFACNSIFVSTVLGLTAGPSPWRVWQRNFQPALLHFLSFIALGSLIVVAYGHMGVWGLVLCGIPFLVVRYSFRRYMEIRADLKDFVRALSEVLEEVDPYTRHHSNRVSQYAVRLARGMHLRESEVEEIEYAALVHDLGKIGPHHQNILQKPGMLSHEEQRTLRAHPGAGADIVARVRALRRASEIVRSHHERPDGKGYPFGLLADDVPLGARILNVADAFDAMTSDRPYRRALSVTAALRELERGAGSQFDTGVVTCLFRMHESNEFPIVPSPSREDLLQLQLRVQGGAR
jgi:HD-GYP domain-containing protein (c-di-GMP phosphodiesterase class II)